MRKNNIIKNGNKTYTVGIMGTGPGVGVTHFAIELAVFLAKVAGQNVALVELNKENILGQVGIILKNLNHTVLKKSERIGMYAHSDASELSQVVSMGYDYVIVDYGFDYSDNLNQFLMCGTKFVVGSLSWLKIHEYVGFITKVSEKAFGKSFVYLANSAVSKGIRYLKHNYDIKVRLIPYEPDMFCLGEESLDFLQGIAGNFLIN